MSYLFYKVVHLAGIFLMLLALGGVATHAQNGGTKQDNSARKKLAFFHGGGLFLILLGGFGMLAKLGIHWPWPSWVIAKFTIWILLGGLIALLYRKPAFASRGLYITFVLAFLAAYVAIYKFI